MQSYRIPEWKAAFNVFRKGFLHARLCSKMGSDRQQTKRLRPFVKELHYLRQRRIESLVSKMRT